jgi:hypothetical protein
VKFTYQSYLDLLNLLRDGGYAFTDYHHYAEHERCVLMRHDIDLDMAQALRLAETEAKWGVHSTWFVLLRTDFYNVASKESLAIMRAMHEMGHEIGLHFDELAYEDTKETVPERIQKETAVLSQILGWPVTTVSMHQPSAQTLQADYQFPGIVNSYGKTFFHDFKYLSDSCHNWREPVEEIVRAGQYERLHILTHAIWYHEQEETICETLRSFISSANEQRYKRLVDNTPIYETILQEGES